MIEKAIIAINPNASFSSGENIDRIRWHDGNPLNITKEQIQAKIVELQSEFDAQAYARTRQQNYPNTDDLIVALWEKVMEGRSESADALEVKRQEIKTANPKPE